MFSWKTFIVLISIYAFKIILTYAFINTFFNINFLGKNEWSEHGLPFPFGSVADIEDVKNENLDLLVVPQYGRNPDHIG